MTRQATARQRTITRRRRWSAVAVATALGVSGIAGREQCRCRRAPTPPSRPPTARPRRTPPPGTTGTAAEGTAAGGSLPGEGIEIAFIQGVIGDGFYISMECGVQDAADALGALGQRPGTRRLRRDAAEPDHRCRRGERAGRHPRRPQRRRGLGRTVAAGPGGRDRGHPRRHDRQRRVDRSITDRLGQLPRRGDGCRRPGRADR